MPAFLKRIGGRPGDPPEMSFLDHLEELRWHIIKALIGLLIATAVCGIYADFIVQDILMKPLRDAGLKAQVLTPYGIVLLYMQTVLICGLIVSMPNTLLWLWKFVAPGLLPRERRYAARVVAFTSLCFFGGVAFSYFILLPYSLTFFATFGTRTIDLNIAIDHYIGFILTLLLGAGLVFELPMISWFLTRIGFLTPEFMRQYRRHSIVVILILSALVTPTPDPLTQLMLAVPLLLLYETSIVVSRMALKKTAEDAASAPENAPAGEETSS